MGRSDVSHTDMVSQSSHGQRPDTNFMNHLFTLYINSNDDHGTGIVNVWVHNESLFHD